MTPVEKWAEQVRAGEVRAVSRAITAIENHAPEAEELLRLLFPHTGRAYLTGVTGAPGTGKSTLVDRLAAYHRKQHEQVGVIAVDRRVRIRAERFWATAFECRDMPATRGRLSARWRHGDFWAGWRERRRKWRCCWMPRGKGTC